VSSVTLLIYWEKDLFVMFDEQQGVNVRLALHIVVLQVRDKLLGSNYTNFNLFNSFSFDILLTCYYFDDRSNPTFVYT
jgi:hypothetical protein